MRNLCSPAGRGIPDVSAQAINFGIVVNGKAVPFSGTSCSTPVHLSLLPPLCFVRLTANVQTVAGIISLLTDYLIWQGHGPLGWLNPWLYSDGLALGGFNDIMSGFNPGCVGVFRHSWMGSSSSCDTRVSSSFPMMADFASLVTGLGTLDFVKLKNILAKRVEVGSGVLPMDSNDL